jgi:hypothetical protein
VGLEVCDCGPEGLQQPGSVAGTAGHQPRPIRRRPCRSRPGRPRAPP